MPNKFRIRITVRGDGVELRGYLESSDPADSTSLLSQFARDMKPYGVVVASVAPDDYNPFTGTATTRDSGWVNDNTESP